MSKSGIYCILNLMNGKLYIGSAVDVKNRCRTHKANLNLNKHPNKHIQSAWNEFGGCFEFIILEYVEHKSDLLCREMYWLELTLCYKPEFGYNKRQIPNSNLGLKLGPYSQARKDKLSLAQKGRTLSQDQIEILRKANLGKKHTLEHCAKVSAAGKGRVFTEERKSKISQALSRPDKWPHPDKYNCKCRKCLDKKNLDRNLRRYNHMGVYHV